MAEPASQQGFTLVESLVAIVILGLVVAAMVGGLATTITTSDIHRQESETNTVLVSTAETVKLLAYAPCATTYMPTNTLPPSWPATAVSVSVQYWNGSGWDGVCHDGDGTSLFPMQLVNIVVTDPGQRASASIDIVKRAP